MNERIKELELQCYVTLTKAGLDGCHEKTSTIFDKEKFAELIVRECASVMQKNVNLNYDHSLDKQILKHFGVEE